VLFNTLFGFLMIRWRIQTLSLWLRIFLFIGCILPFICPFSAVNIDGIIGNTNFIGYYAGGKMMGDIWGQIFTSVYACAVTLPAVIIASCLSVSTNFYLIFIVDGMFWVFGMFIAVYFMNTYLTESVGTKYANASMFMISPIVQLLVLITNRLCSTPAPLKGDYETVPGSVASVL
jgi:hypothetical protein